MDGPSLTVLIAVTFGVISSALCFVAGAILLEESCDDFGVLSQALGWYFVAKGFFLGPSLAIAGLAYDRTRAVSAPAE